MNNKIYSPIGDNWNDLRKELFTDDEIKENELMAEIMGTLIRTRKEKGISQRKLGQISGIKQPVIARMETGRTSPRLDTLIKILKPLGKKIIIVDEKIKNKTY